jgi:microcystin degradation protein MlrC
MTRRVLIAGFKHETNTFSRLPTDMAAYKSRAWYLGDEIAKAYAGTNTELAAFMEGAKRYGWQPVLSISADATPSGRVTSEVFEAVSHQILGDIDRAGGVDAVLLNLHGAMVCAHTDDGEGELLARIRAKVGPGVPIGASLDLHANVTDAMAANADVLVSYCTYPHVDMHEIATRVVDLIHRALEGKCKPVTSVARARMLVGVDEGRTTAPGPMTEALALADAIEKRPGVLAVSINAGFGWADIADAGPSAVIVTDGARAETKAQLTELTDFIWQTRNRRTVETVRVADAIAVAQRKGRPGSPVVIADYADNPGGGGYTDSPSLLRAMLAAGLTDAAMSALYDPESAAACHRAGIGASLPLAIGGKIDPAFGAPIEAEATVIGLSDGRFKIEGPMMRGVAVDMGPSAAVRIGSVEVVLASRRYQNYDLGFFRCCGIEPRKKAVIAVKSMQHFRAAYAPIAGEIVVVDEGGGVTSADFKKLPFHRVRRPIWPLDMD